MGIIEFFQNCASIGETQSGFTETISWVKTIAPALISAFLSGYLLSRYKSKEDNLDKRCDEICKEANEVAILARDYWIKSAQEVAQGVEALLATDIKVRMLKIAGLRTMIEQMLSQSATKELIRAEQLLLREITGGNFGVHNRNLDIERARSVLYEASNFTVAVRSARMNDIKGWRQRK
jgi:hypothetical protein